MRPSRRQQAVPQHERPALTWGRRARTLASVLIVLHLAAVMVAPWSQPPPASELSGRVAGWFAPYLQAMYLNHGYRFFNEPGPGHAVRYTLEMPDGSQQQGMFPDPDKLGVGESQWPRQWYHRGFMMAEQAVAAVAGAPDGQLANRPPPGFQFETPELKADYERARTAYFAHLKSAAGVMQSLARALLEEHGADAVRLELGTRRLPSRDEIQQGIEAGGPELLRWDALGSLRRDGDWQWSEVYGGTHGS